MSRLKAADSKASREYSVMSRCEEGWSKGEVGKNRGCTGGRWGGGCGKTTNHPLPSLPYTTLSAGSGGEWYWNGALTWWGGGGGGIYVNGSGASRSYSQQGYGYGAGGGGSGSSQYGLRGVAILFTGDGVVDGQDIAW